MSSFDYFARGSGEVEEGRRSDEEEVGSATARDAMETDGSSIRNLSFAVSDASGASSALFFSADDRKMRTHLNRRREPVSASLARSHGSEFRKAFDVVFCSLLSPCFVEIVPIKKI